MLTLLGHSDFSLLVNGHFFLSFLIRGGRVFFSKLGHLCFKQNGYQYLPVIVYLIKHEGGKDTGLDIKRPKFWTRVSQL